MKKLITLIGALSLFSCTYVRPMNEEYKMIGNIPYSNTMNCVDRGVVYSRILKSEGFNSRMVMGKRFGSPKGVHHLWVEHFKEGVWYNTELNLPIDEVKDRTRLFIYDWDATKKDIDGERKRRKLK